MGANTSIQKSLSAVYVAFFLQSIYILNGIGEVLRVIPFEITLMDAQLCPINDRIVVFFTDRELYELDLLKKDQPIRKLTNIPRNYRIEEVKRKEGGLALISIVDDKSGGLLHLYDVNTKKFRKPEYFISISVSCMINNLFERTDFWKEKKIVSVTWLSRNRALLNVITSDNHPQCLLAPFKTAQVTTLSQEHCKSAKIVDNYIVIYYQSEKIGLYDIRYNLCEKIVPFKAPALVVCVRKSEVYYFTRKSFASYSLKTGKVRVLKRYKELSGTRNIVYGIFFSCREWLRRSECSYIFDFDKFYLTSPWDIVLPILQPKSMSTRSFRNMASLTQFADICVVLQ
jgi:hypothetical protein